MIEEFKYKDKVVGKNEKDEGSLKNLVNEEFKNIERKNGVGYRDDQEIRNAGRNICNKIIKEIQKDKTKVYGSRALEPLTKLISALKTEYNNMKGMKLFTNNEDKINQVAQRIDNAENETLKRLAKNRTTQDSRDIVKKGNEIHKDKPMFLMEGGNDVKKQTGNIIFTEAANPVKIHEALKGLFTNPNIVYEIDYSRCDTSTPKGKAIKEKMTNLMGTQTCYLRYDSNQKTYTIRNSEGNGISNRAYIWKGVKLIPAGIRKWKSYVEEKNGKEKLGQETVYNADKLGQLTLEMIKDVPSMKNWIKEGKLTTKDAVQLCQKTEIRLNNLLKNAKKLGYELESKCITRKHFGRGHMELHLNSGSSEVDWTIWGNDGSYNKDLGKDLDNFIDSNEGEYKTYLTKRVKQKRQEFDSLTKTETSNISKKGGKDGWEKLNPKEREKKEQEAEQHKQQVLYGIGLLERMVYNYRETEGDSWDNNDIKLVQIKQLIRNAKSSIENTIILDDNALTKNFINPIREKWAEIKHITKVINTRTTSYGQGGTYENPAYKEQYNQLKNVFLGEKTQQISAIRSLGGHGRLFDKTETSFLAEEIEGNEDLTVKNADIKECINNIKTRLPGSIFDKNGNIIQNRKEQFDKMFTAATKGTDSLISLLVNSKMLPVNRKDEESEVRNCVENLKDQLNTINKQSEIPNITASIKQKEKAEKLKLEQKSNKTEEEIQRLQALTFLENHAEQRDTINQEVIERTRLELRYFSLGDTVKSCLFPALAELGGGAEGKNSDIYNDIKGYGTWNLSDENAKKWSEEIIEDIIIEVAITAVSIALAPTGAGETIYLSFRVAKASAKGLKGLNKLRKSMGVFTKSLGKKMVTQYASKFSVKSAKATKEITKASHIATSTEKGIKGLKFAKRTKDAYQTIKATETFGSLAGKLAMKGGSMVIEGVGFHLNSTVIHNAIEGKILSEGINPFGYTEGPNGEKMSNFKNYVQSVAFLGVLKTVSKPIQGLTGNMAKGILGKYYDANWLTKMAKNIVSNIVSMSGEMGSMMGTDQILSRTFDQKFKPVTAEDLVSMFGMVAGLRLTNKVYLKIQEYDGKSVTVQMNQGNNTFNVKMDREGNVIKIEGKDKDGNKIQNPQEVLGIKSGVRGQNLRETHNGKEVGTVKGNLRQLNNLHEGDIITVKHGENDVKFKKNKNGNREVIEAGKIENDRFKPGEEYIAKENKDGSGFHLETKAQGGPKISLDGKVGVKLGTPVRTHNEYRYESLLSEREQTELAEDFDKNLRGKGIKIDGDIYTMKLNGSTYTIYKNGKEIAKGLGNEAIVKGKESLILANSESNTKFLTTYNKIKTDYLISEEVKIILFNNFTNELMSQDGVTIEGINYKLENQNNNFIYTETNIYTGKEIVRRTAKNNINVLPENHKGNDIREHMKKGRAKYVQNNFKSEFEKVKSKVINTKIETPIDFRELTESGRYQIEIEQLSKQLDLQLNNFIEHNYFNFTFKEFSKSLEKAGIFIEGLHKRIQKIQSKPNIKIPNKFRNTIKNNINEISNKRGNQFNEHYRELTTKISNFLDKIYSNIQIGKKWEKLITYDEKLKFLIENFHMDGLTKPEIESLTKEQIIKLNELKKLGFLHGNISLLKLTNNEISTLRQLKDLGVNIFSYTNELSKFTPEQINTLKELKDLGVDLSFDTRELSKFTPEQINTLKELKDLGVDLGLDAIKLSKLKSEQIKILKELKDLGIDISEVFPNYGRNLIDFKPEEIKKLQSIHKIFGGIKITKDNFLELIALTDVQLINLIELKNNLGVKITDLNFRECSELTGTEINNKIMVVNKIGIPIDDIFEEGNLKRITSLSDADLNNLQNIKQELDNLKISINIANIDQICKLNESDIINFKRIKPALDELGIEIYGMDVKKWSSINASEVDIKIAKAELARLGIQIEKPEELSIILDIISVNRGNNREYIKRKNEYLEKNLTLGKEETISGKKINKIFDQLFKEGNDSGKYGIQNINQTGLGYCYAYTGFELLKKSNFFDVLIKTSMKETTTGWEVKLPLGDPNGHIIKINNNEIDKNFVLKYEEEGKNVEEPVSINSDSSLGFKILEIAFIKEYSISNSKYDDNPHAMQARTEYKNTGDITITPELLQMIESGKPTEFLEHMLSKNIVNSYDCLENKVMQQSLLKFVNNGNIKISPRRDGNINITPIKIENGHYENGTLEILGSHAYSIERTYRDSKTKENIVVIVNPHKTAEKIHIKAEDCLTLFPTRRVSTININNIFK